MKKLIIAAALVAAFIQPVQADSKIEICINLGELGRVIMEQRQAGTSMTTMFGRIGDGDPQDPLVEMVHTMLIEAYDSPKYNTPKFVQESIDEFANRVQVDCMRSYQ